MAAEREAASALQELEVEAIEMFINFLRLIGLPKSVGEIYGLLFVAPRPMAMDDIMDRLEISLGAASQGLKLLRSFGAVRVVYERGERRVSVVDDKDPKPIGLPEPLLPFEVVGRGIPRVTQRRWPSGFTRWDRL